MDGSPSPLLADEQGRRYGNDGRLSVRLKRSRLAGYARRHRGLLMFVGLPTLVAGVYFFAFAADQYQSEAQFVIYSSHGGAMQLGGLGQMLGLGEAGGSESSETFSVIDYMQSHDAVGALNQKLNLVKIFRSPAADPVSRIWSANPSAEHLLRYYTNMVTVTYKQDTGITTLDVNAFTPQDSYNIANTLLTLGEQRVNAYNDRISADTVSVAENEVTLAQNRIERAEDAMTSFREQHRDLNPELSGTADMTLIAQLQGQLAQANAQLAQMQGLSPTSPQELTVHNRIAALQAQITAQNGTLTGEGGALAPLLAQYQDLSLRLQFAQQTYTATQTALVTAREDAQKQQLFLIRVVQPNLPQTALFPKRFTIVATIFAGLLVAYGIGWLLIAGVREHAI
jgi:capsular polysaccharide transport system permease protein